MTIHNVRFEETWGYKMKKLKCRVGKHVFQEFRPASLAHPCGIPGLPIQIFCEICKKIPKKYQVEEGR